MSLSDIVALFSVMLMLALIPSASVALVVARSSTAGFWNGAAVAAGIVVGDLVFVLLAVLGMSVLSEVLSGLFLVLRYVASVYLMWFGFSLLRHQRSSPTAAPGRGVSSLYVSFFSGLALTMGDVKAIVFYASLFPAFVDLATISLLDMAAIIGVTVVAVGSVKLGYAYAARNVLSFAVNVKVERAIKRIAGSLMILAGIYLMATA